MASSPTVSSISVSGKTVTLTLSSAIVTSDLPLLSYSSSSGSVQDASFNSLADFSSVTVDTSADTTPPSISGAVATSLNSVTVTFSENVDADATNGSHWSLGGTDAGSLTVSANTDPAGSSDSMTLTLSGDLPDTRPDLSLIYTKPPTGGITDGTNQLEGATVIVVDGIAPTVTGARAASGTVVTLTLSEDVSDASATPGDFSLSGVASSPTVSSISASGKTVTLTLSSAIVTSDLPLLSYSSSSGSVQDASFNSLADFSSVAVDTSADITPLTARAFVTTWKTTTADESITLPLVGTDMTIDWGDGNTTTGVLAPVDHTYGTAGDYTVRITGDLTRFHLNGAADASKLVSLDQWGTASWTTMENAFRGAGNMAYNATDSPNLASVTDMYRMFDSASSFNGDLSRWNVSLVTDMSRMFSDASSFNGDISSWDVSSVDNMSNMFFSAFDFDGDLSRWNVSSVTSMSNMFFFASSFNGDLSSWDVSSVDDMSNMFVGAFLFDQNLGNWYVVPADTTYATSEGTLNVTTISTQNAFLDDPSLLYGIGIDSGGNSNLFNITDSKTLMFKNATSTGIYTVNVTASGGSVFESGNHWRILNIAVTGSANAAPNVDAGNDRQVDEGGSITLQGSGSDPDGNDSDLTYSWSQSPAAPVISFDNQNSATPEITAPPVTAETEITLTLRVDDGTDHATDTMVLTIRDVPLANQAPSADAGNDRQVDEGGSITLQGSGSDPDGNDSDLTYSWSQSPAAPVISFDNQNSATPEITAPPVTAKTEITLTLTVDDGTTSGEDTMVW